MSSRDLAGALLRASDRLRDLLLVERGAEGHWEGELSTSALSTATASFALTMVDRAAPGPAPGEGSPHDPLILGGLSWLAAHANADGGWGDTVRSHSNISTTTLAWAALHAVPRHRERFRAVLESADGWIARHAGSTEPEALARAIVEAYGEDHTFSAPILTMCQLAGRLGDHGWDRVLQLPLELAVLPRGLFRFLHLRVVSYALPALIAVGLVRHHHRPSRNVLLRALRGGFRERTLRVLGAIQPVNGGFLEAVPLTSFVCMSLVASGHAAGEVSRRATRFLEGSVRSDGSWPIDTNLATWVTTLSIDALAETDPALEVLGANGRERVLEWLLAQQYRAVHPYTDAAPGGWAWTDLPGGVPDADDTSGALLALAHLDPGSPARPPVRDAVRRGLTWLLDLQNRDGGIPTFCRGWGKLPFDRSGADLTAHALRALAAWRDRLGGAEASLAQRIERASVRAAAFLIGSQRSDGAWSPLWFGSQDSPRLENPCYGTSRVLRAIDALSDRRRESLALEGAVRRGAAWLAGSQNDDGGWGGDRGVKSSVEETALAVSALAGRRQGAALEEAALRRGLSWLLRAVDDGSVLEASPIGFYFAKLWYFERLYPLALGLAALGRARRRGAGEAFFDEGPHAAR